MEVRRKSRRWSESCRELSPRMISSLLRRMHSSGYSYLLCCRSPASELGSAGYQDQNFVFGKRGLSGWAMWTPSGTHLTVSHTPIPTSYPGMALFSSAAPRFVDYVLGISVVPLAIVLRQTGVQYTSSDGHHPLNAIHSASIDALRVSCFLTRSRRHRRQHQGPRSQFGRKGQPNRPLGTSRISNMGPDRANDMKTAFAWTMGSPTGTGQLMKVVTGNLKLAVSSSYFSSALISGGAARVNDATGSAFGRSSAPAVGGAKRTEPDPVTGARDVSAEGQASAR